jgi:hypothetical protein
MGNHYAAGECCAAWLSGYLCSADCLRAVQESFVYDTAAGSNIGCLHKRQQQDLTFCVRHALMNMPCPAEQPTPQLKCKCTPEPQLAVRPLAAAAGW